MSRGSIMLGESMKGLAGLDSFSYMYTTGERWTAGDVLVGRSSNKRFKLDPTSDATEYEVRRVEGAAWWRIRGADGWRTGVPAEIDDRTLIDVDRLVNGTGDFIAESGDVRMLRPGSIVNPLSQNVSAHYLTGSVSIRGARSLGLGTPEGAEDGDRVIFDLWIEQDSGVPAKLVLHGVPPSRHPTGVLYLFDLDGLSENAILAPHPDSMAKGWSATADENMEPSEARMEMPPLPPIPLRPGEIPAPDLLTPEERRRAEQLEAMSEPGGPAPVEQSSAWPDPTAPTRSLFVEEHPVIDDPGWTRHVLPTEGYAVEIPSSWTVTGVAKDGGSMLTARDESGANSLAIHRAAEPEGLLALAQERMSELRRPVDGSDPGPAVELVLDTDRQVPRALLIYMDGDDVIHEHLTTRSPLGSEGIAYSMVFTAGLTDDRQDVAGIRVRIADSLTLLGFAGGSR